MMNSMAAATFTVDWTETAPPDCRGGAVTVGNFDGLHRGHAALLAGLSEAARAARGPAIAVTFDPPPARLLAPFTEPPLLTTLADRAALLPAGVERLLILRTTPALLELSAESFYERVLRGGLAARAVVEGFNFRFGHGRAGDTALLARLCARDGLAFAAVPPLELDGSPVSSSRIRSALLAGDVTAAARWLGRPYRLRGIVAPGAMRGRTIGFPTANLSRTETLVPRDGVYACLATPENGLPWSAAINVGPNPTFGEASRKLEVHLIGFHGDLYGQVVTVDLIARLRDTRTFAGVGELVEQVRRDVEEARLRVEAYREGGG